MARRKVSKKVLRALAKARRVRAGRLAGRRRRATRATII